MGTVKIELDLPNFEKEIELKVIINKDGVQSSTPLIDRKPESINCQLPSDSAGQGWKQTTTCVAHPDPTVTVYGAGTLSSQPQPQAAQAQVSKPIPSSMMGTF